MIFKTFRLKLILRVCLLALTLAVLIYLWLETEFYVSMTLLAVVVLIQIVSLIGFIEKTNRLLTRFLDAIRYSDFTGNFSDSGLESNFGELNRAFSDVLEKFREERSEKEETLRYLEMVVQHIGTGLICFNSDGEVVLMNRSAKKLFPNIQIRSIQSFVNVSESFAGSLAAMGDDGRTLQRVETGAEVLELALHSAEFRIRGGVYKLISFQNIQSELEEKELESWQNITKVLAHEIMNSITPIASLSSTVHSLIQSEAVHDGDRSSIDRETLQDIDEALQTINNRCHGLMRFVNSYRDFTQIPEPDAESFEVERLLARVIQLMKGEFENRRVESETITEPPDLQLFADPQLIEQVIINITKNALQVLEGCEGARVRFRAGINDAGRVEISIEDNGPGMEKEILNRIFIPFYTTPSGNQPVHGSGIGLSLSRQIMRNHGGSLHAESEPGKGTVFTMRF
ncbi:sensor histidine kinase [Rhodohalobacter mucosus]|nr:HAMP domain-containing sensor histidine kinase [Rhodohalobacter mucosus]